MNFEIMAKGHPNVSSLHKSTFEITKDKSLTKAGDCIIGLDMNKSMLDFPEDFKNKLQSSNTKVTVQLKTDNGYDEIHGRGDSNLELSHETDMVIRKSTFTCNRTLMVEADKAACDLNRDLIEDLINAKQLYVNIILD
ncbi:MAG: DUF371 domain-containing protein [Methanobrevibacter sp.]